MPETTPPWILFHRTNNSGVNQIKFELDFLVFSRIYNKIAKNIKLNI
jgi:hypothetical protein